MSKLLFVLLVLFLDNNVMSSNFLESSCNLFSYDDNLSSCEIAATTAGGVPEVFLWVFGTVSSINLVDYASPSLADVQACWTFSGLPA